MHRARPLQVALLMPLRRKPPPSFGHADRGYLGGELQIESTMTVAIVENQGDPGRSLECAHESMAAGNRTLKPRRLLVAAPDPLDF